MPLGESPVLIAVPDQEKNRVPGVESIDDATR
jgi:hypothetical protein